MWIIFLQSRPIKSNQVSCSTLKNEKIQEIQMKCESLRRLGNFSSWLRPFTFRPVFDDFHDLLNRVVRHPTLFE
jgi:hypothetical protein